MKFFKKMTVAEWYRFSAFCYGYAAWTLLGYVLILKNDSLKFNSADDPVPEGKVREVYRSENLVYYLDRPKVAPLARLRNFIFGVKPESTDTDK